MGVYNLNIMLELNTYTLLQYQTDELDYKTETRFFNSSAQSSVRGYETVPPMCINEHCATVTHNHASLAPLLRLESNVMSRYNGTN